MRERLKPLQKNPIPDSNVMIRSLLPTSGVGVLAVSLFVLACGAHAAEDKRQVPQNKTYIGNRLQESISMMLLPERSTYTLRPRENQEFSCPPIMDAIAFAGAKAAFNVRCGKQYAVMGRPDAPELREVTTD